MRSSIDTRNRGLDAMLAPASLLQIFDSARPSSPGDSPSDEPLCEMRLASPAFNPARNGVAVLRSANGSEAARDSRQMKWFRVVGPDSSCVYDGRIGLEGQKINPGDAPIDLRVKSLMVAKGTVVNVKSLSVRLPV